MKTLSFQLGAGRCSGARPAGTAALGGRATPLPARLPTRVSSRGQTVLAAHQRLFASCWTMSRLWLLSALLVLGLGAQAQSVLQFSATTYTVAEDAGTVALAIQRTNDLDTVVSVDYATADGTATNGLKYTTVSGTLAFGAWETNKTIVVPILNEGFVEGT